MMLQIPNEMQLKDVEVERLCLYVKISRMLVQTCPIHLFSILT
jgi:hypothetical protein